MTELNKRVIDGIAPVTLADCVMIGDGTSDTLLDRLQTIGNNTSYNGKRALWLGDSISVSGSPNYPKYVCDALGMTLTNKASSGGDAVRMRNILQGLNGYSAINMTQFDYMFMMIGHNCDGVNGVTTSSASISNIPLDDTSYTKFPNGFYTDVASCIEYIWDYNPDCKIYLITPIQSSNGRYALTTPAAQEALKEIGNLYSIPVIDVFGECGISRKNIDRFSSDKIHPNTLGVQTIGDYIINYLSHR